MSYDKQRFMTKGIIKNHGFSLVELMVVFVMISILGAILVPTYVGYRAQIEKKLHVMNAITCQQIVQVGVELGLYSLPATSQTLNVYMSSIYTAEGEDAVIDPSSVGQDPYSDLSFIQIYNNAGTYEYYIKLINKQNTALIYVDITAGTNVQGVKQIRQLTRSDITISQ